MKNYWPDKFEENVKPSAKNILEEQAKLLSKITDGIVFAEVSELEPMKALSLHLNDEFGYRFDIRGKFLDNYRFNVFYFAHDITLYPVKFWLDEKLGSELGVDKSGSRYISSIGAPEDMDEFLRIVLNSDRVKSVVGSIIRLSK